MKKLRMSMKELKELKPSRDNIIKLVCDDGEYSSSMKTVYVFNTTGSYIGGDNDAYTLNSSTIHHYPSFEEEPKTVTIYTGRYLLCTSGVSGTISSIDREHVEAYCNGTDRQQLGESTSKEYEIKEQK